MIKDKNLKCILGSRFNSTLFETLNLILNKMTKKLTFFKNQQKKNSKTLNSKTDEDIPHPSTKTRN